MTWPARPWRTNSGVDLQLTDVYNLGPITLARNGSVGQTDYDSCFRPGG